MKINQCSGTGVIFTLALVFFQVQVFPLHLHGDTALIPGDINRVCYYTDFYYNFPSDDFFYYLNDGLLFTEKPDGIIIEKGLRNRLLKIVHWHQSIKKSLRRVRRNQANQVSIDISDSKGLKKVSALMDLLGLRINKTSKGLYHVTQNSEPDASDYFRFTLLKPNMLTRDLNKTHRFTFQLRETEIPIPWDYKFLREITGLKIEATSFFETLLKNERLSLLLGILYRLSDREINHISHLVKKPKYGAWKQIYQDKKFLMGMFLLSHALRVTDDDDDDDGDKEGHQWELPGGLDAEAFWNEAARNDCKKAPMEFLYNLATKDDGKLNYLFLFGSFLPPSAQRTLFVGLNGQKMLKIYRLIPLTKKEKLDGSQFPELRDSNFYTLFYALPMQGNNFLFQPGADIWLRVITRGERVSADSFDLFEALLERSQENKKSISEIQKFVSLYTKFHHRLQLQTEDVLSCMYHNYEEYNVMVDFIEKLPIRKPATALKLFPWAYKFGGLNKRERVLFISLFQSLLELLSHASRYAPDRYDYDTLIEKLIEIPCDRQNFYDGLFAFFKTELKIEPDNKTLIDFVLEGIDNQILNVNGTDYKFIIKDIYRENIKEILQSQGVCTLSTLLYINRLLDQLLLESGQNTIGTGTDSDTDPDTDIGSHISEAFRQLPYAEISKNAPKHIRDRVMAYNRNDLYAELARLNESINNKRSKTGLKSIIRRLKVDYLLPQLKDYLLTLTYAVNAKNPGLRIFLNPNLVRLHEFDERKGRTPWNYCGTPEVTDHFSEYHFSGGLSRLNLSLASKWNDYLFKRTFIHNPAHIQSVIVNLLDFYPPPLVNYSLTYNALLVDFGLELIRKSQDNEAIKEDLLKELRTITTGYHYRKAVNYFNGKSPNHFLFFSEIKKLGEIFFKKGKYLEKSSYDKQLEPFTRLPLKPMMEKENHQFGGIYYHTFGNLIPQQFNLFPQEVSNLFGGGWVSGEMINEFKIKLSWHLYKKQVPSFLLGHILYLYFNEAAPRFLSQNHPNDYSSTYSIFEIFNDSHLRHILKNLQKEGHLKLK